MLAACKQQERVLTACITLSRSEAELGPCEIVDLAAIIADLLQSTDLQGHTATVSLEPAPTTGDPVLIERLLDNLLANAVRHNDPSGWIAITARTKARRAVITHREHRHSDSRRRTRSAVRAVRTDPPAGPHAGLGLGLAVVKAIADAHGAHITAHARPGGGLRTRRRLPACNTGRAVMRAR